MHGIVHFDLTLQALFTGPGWVSAFAKDDFEDLTLLVEFLNQCL